jgi:hypothetical protein
VLAKKLQPPHSHPNSTPTRRGGKTNRSTPAQGCQPQGTTVTPAIAKRIHTEDSIYIQSHQAHMVVAATCHHSFLKGMRGKINTCRCAYTGKGKGQWLQDQA